MVKSGFIGASTVQNLLSGNRQLNLQFWLSICTYLGFQQQSLDIMKPTWSNQLFSTNIQFTIPYMKPTIKLEKWI